MAGRVFSVEERAPLDREARFCAFSGVIMQESFFVDSSSQHLRVLTYLSGLVTRLNG